MSRCWGTSNTECPTSCRRLPMRSTVSRTLLRPSIFRRFRITRVAMDPMAVRDRSHGVVHWHWAASQATTWDWSTSAPSHWLTQNGSDFITGFGHDRREDDNLSIFPANTLTTGLATTELYVLFENI